MKFRCKNLLVTGGAGFIGSNFIDFILKRYQNLKIYNLDALTYAGNLSNTNNFKDNKNYKFLHGDISDYDLVDKLFEDYNIDGVINFAAETHVDNSILNPDIFIKSNIIGVYNLLRLCNKYWMKDNFVTNKNFENSRFHQISTDEVYGSCKSCSFTENDKYNPNSPYSASKASADMLIRSYNKTYGLNTTISICSNNYGLNQNLEKFIPKIFKSLKDNTPINVYGDGLNVRDWIHVEDHCEAVDLIYNKSITGETYNVASKNEVSNLELINKINCISNILDLREVETNFVQDRHGHDFRYSLNIDKIKSDLGWCPKKDFKTELKNLMQNIL